MSYVKGEVTYQVYLNKDNSYGVYKVQIDETNEPSFDFDKNCTITGYFVDIEIGGIYNFKGDMKFNPKYGYSFVAETYERILPKSRDGIIAYLSGDRFKGIGKKTAETIVDILGEDAINQILNDKSVLDKIPSLNALKKLVIYDGLLANKDIENTIISLYSYGVTPMMAMRIYKYYEGYTLDVIRKNPYKIIYDIEGIGFNKADQIALKTGISPKSELRIEACLCYVLKEDANESGNTYMLKEDLVSRVINFLSFDREERELVLKCLMNQIQQGNIFNEAEEVSDNQLHNAEKYIGWKLRKISAGKQKSLFFEEVKMLINRLEESMRITFEDEQKNAIYAALNNNVSIITGGPGTGKTTIVRGILYAYNQLYCSDNNYIKLCAPTGKAAKRIEESTGLESKTIHKLLGFDISGHFFYNKFNLLDVKLLIVDESSMVDTFLFERLLEALPDNVKLVIVGDYDQLPSIGPGQILKDLIDSNAFCTTRLFKIHRQKENSKIISLAYNILEGEINTELDDKHSELAFIPTDKNNYREVLKNVVDHFINLGYSLHNDIQVLIPIYKSSVGIEATNKYLQMAFNSNYNFETLVENNQYFLDDKVIQLVNQYEDGIMNGDMGIISDLIGEKEVKVNFQGNEVSYKGQDIYNIQLAYSISVHKSQGSEFKVVIVPIFSNYNVILNKKLIYTAVTRAKEHLIILGNNRVLSNAITIHSEDRLTKLKTFL